MSSDRKQLAWGMVDQGFSSASNFGGSILAARMLSTTEFGAFSIGFALYVIVLGLSRAWSSEPLVVRYAASEERNQADAIRRGATTAFTAGVLGGAALCVAGFLLSSAVRTTLFAVALFLPALMLQDFWRYALILRRRSRDAAVNDLTWLVVLVVAFAAARSHNLTAAGAVVLWAAGAVVGCLVGLVQLRMLPARRFVAWMRGHRDLSWPYTGEFLLLSGAGMLLTVGLGAIGGLGDAGGFRGALVALGPLGILFMGTSMQVTPMMARRIAAGRADLRRLGIRVSGALGAVAAGWGLMLLLIPDHLGEKLLGSSWQSAQDLIPILSGYYVSTALMLGATVGLRALGAARTALKLRLVVAPIGLGLGLLGAIISGSKGAALGLLIGNAIALPLWWRTFVREANAHRSAERSGVPPFVLAEPGDSRSGPGALEY